MSHTIFKSPFPYVLTAVCLVIAGASVGADKPTEAPPDRDAFAERLQSGELNTIYQTVERMRSDRSKMIKELIALIEPSKAAQDNKHTRAAAVYLLGELRASEAVPVLAKALENEPYRTVDANSSQFYYPVTLLSG